MGSPENEDDSTDKSFEGPDGQEFDDFEHCVRTISGDGTSMEEAKQICGNWQDGHQKYHKNETEKRRVYIGDPNEAPDWANVQEGQQGGYYYETDDSAEDQSYEEAQETLDEEMPGGHTVRDVASGMASEAMDEMDGGAWEYHEPEEVADALEDRVRDWAQDNLNTEQEVELFVDQALTDFENHLQYQRSAKRRVYISDHDDVGDLVDSGKTFKRDEDGKLYYERTMTETPQRTYIGSEDEAPDGATVKEDENGHLFYLQQEPWEQARALYSDRTEDQLDEETNIDTPDAESPTDEGVTGESGEDEEREDLAEEIEEES